MWKNNWPFLKTHEHVKAIRQTVNPNGGFIGQLLEVNYEKNRFSENIF